MAVSKVKMVSIIGMMSSLDSVVDVCFKSASFHPEKALSFYSNNTDEFLAVEYKNEFNQPLKDIQELAKQVDIQIKSVDASNFSTDLSNINRFIKSLKEELGDIIQIKKELKEKIEDCRRSLRGIDRFVGMDLNIKEIRACEYLKVRFGSLPKESYHKLDSYKESPYILFFPFTKDGTHYWGTYFCPIEYLPKVDKIFADLYFEELDMLSLFGPVGTPEEQITKLKEKIQKCRAKIAEIDEKIAIFIKYHKVSCNKFYSKAMELKTCVDIKKYAYQYKDYFILAGWIPSEKQSSFEMALNEIYGIEYSIENAQEFKNYSPPVQIKNKRFVKPFEFFIDMYGLPSYNEIDPTAFVAITYTLLFGMMFGDVGQGAVLAIAGYFAWKHRKMALGRVLVPCGISSCFFGLIYGSVFGLEHALDPFYRGVFGLAHKPIEIMEPGSIIAILGASIGLGAIMIMVSMGMSIYSSFKQKKRARAILSANGIAGLTFYGGRVLTAAMYQVNFSFAASIVYNVITFLLPLLCMFLHKPLGKLIEGNKNWKPESWSSYCIQSFLELFEEILSFLTNTLSFLRVGAYVLVHTCMMMVFSTLGEMLGGVEGVGWLLHVIIMILGNIIVIGLEGLLVGIQVVRLEFYEMFSRFFEGQGREFNPVKVKNLSSKT